MCEGWRWPIDIAFWSKGDISPMYNITCWDERPSYFPFSPTRLRSCRLSSKVFCHHFICQPPWACFHRFTQFLLRSFLLHSYLLTEWFVGRYIRYISAAISSVHQYIGLFPPDDCRRRIISLQVSVKYSFSHTATLSGPRSLRSIDFSVFFLVISLPASAYSYAWSPSPSLF